MPAKKRRRQRPPHPAPPAAPPGAPTGTFESESDAVPPFGQVATGAATGGHGAKDPGLKLPHEREQSPGRVANPEPQPVIEQAKKDIDAGLVDTDLRATPGLDAARRREIMRPAPAKKRTGGKKQ